MLKDGQRLFGTDGIRGRANAELTPEFAMALGRAAGEPLGGPVLVGRDTRRSGDMLSAALQAGFHSVGVDTVDVGIIPTGAVSYLAGQSGVHMAVMVSASHNPAPDNGIKFIARDGTKLADDREDRIEERLRRGSPWVLVDGGMIGMRLAMSDASDRYLEHLSQAMPYSLRGIDVVVDCANGAAFRTAPALLTRLKASVEPMACEPDGTNINEACGATHPEAVAEVARGRLGLAFDGDADRLIAVDENGRVANGDVILAVIAEYWKDAGRLKNNVVVGTVMANLGFRRAMTRLGIDLVETKVGDRYVFQAMRSHKAVLGGEQSGHVIFRDLANTGDGLLTAVRLLEVLAATGKPLRELRGVITEYPQVLRNVPVADRERLSEATELWQAVKDREADLGEDGRILVRASGTEPLVRIMVEAAGESTAADVADELAAITLRELGGEVVEPH